MDIKLESDDQLIKQESFEEEIYSLGNDGQFQLQSTGLGDEHSEMGAQEMMSEGMNGDFGSTSMAAKPTKRARKYKSKAPSTSANNKTSDIRAKLERSRQSARECRARKKLRYQYLEDLVCKRENNNLKLKKEIEQVLIDYFLNSFNLFILLV